MSTIVQPAAECPTWCSNQADAAHAQVGPDERPEDSCYDHRKVTFADGDDSVMAEVFQWWDGRVHRGDQAVWVNINNRQCTPSEALILAAKLVEAAVLIDKANGGAK